MQKPVMQRVEFAAFVMPAWDTDYVRGQFIHGDQFRFIPCEGACAVLYYVWGWEVDTQTWKLINMTEDQGGALPLA